MPTYQYACTACDHRFDQVQAFSDPSLTECPECSGRLRKLYGSVGVVFKGSGFYRTDSRAKSSAASGSSEGSSDKSEKKETGAAAKETTTSSTTSGADKSPSTSSSTSTTTPAAKAS